MAKNDAKKFCTKCKKVMSVGQFYMSNNKEKYKDGYLDQCKQCLTMKVDNWNSDTFLWILQEADVPYVVEEWNKLLATYGQDKTKVTGMTIIGRYLGKMKLKQYGAYRWKDSEFLQKLTDNKTEEKMRQAGYGAAEIAAQLAENHTLIPDTQQVTLPQEYTNPESFSNGGYGNSYEMHEEEPDEFDDDLTEEDKRYLRLKWGRYRPEEWIRLEQLYEKMKNDYAIEGAGHEDTLILVCKTSLKSNQLLDMGDIDGATKATKMYNDLMKSGHFTADQNKKKQDEILNSISELTLMCEQEGFIPRFYIEKPNDKVDAIIQDLKDYTHSVITEELNLGNLIESAVRQMSIEEAKEEDEDIDDEDLTLDDIQNITDKDHEEFFDMVDSESSSDDDIIAKFLEQEGGAAE